MAKIQKWLIIFGIIFLLLPLLHLVYLLFFIPIFKTQFNIYLSYFTYMISSIAKVGGVYMNVWLLDLLIFFLLGILMIFTNFGKKHTVKIISITLLIFIPVNVFLLIALNQLLLEWLFPVLFITFVSLIMVLYITFKSIRKSSFMLLGQKLNHYSRHRCFLDVEISGNVQSYKVIGKIINISISDCITMSSEPVIIGKEYQLLFKIQNDEFTAEAKSIRIVPGYKEIFNACAYRIISMPVKMKQKLKKYLNAADPITLFNGNEFFDDVSVEITEKDRTYTYPVFEMNTKGAEIITADKWPKDYLLTTKFFINQTGYEAYCKISRINDKEAEVNKPDGFAVEFLNPNKKLIQILEQI